MAETAVFRTPLYPLLPQVPLRLRIALGEVMVLVWYRKLREVAPPAVTMIYIRDRHTVPISERARRVLGHTHPRAFCHHGRILSNSTLGIRTTWTSNCSTP